MESRGRSWPFFVRASLRRAIPRLRARGRPCLAARTGTAKMQRVALAATDLGDHRREAISWKQAHAFLTHMRDASSVSPTAATYGCTLNVGRTATVRTRLTPSRASGSIGLSTRRRTEGVLAPSQDQTVHAPVEGKWEHWALNSPPDGGEIDTLGVSLPRCRTKPCTRLPPAAVSQSHVHARTAEGRRRTG